MPGVAFKTRLKRQLRTLKAEQKLKWQLQREKPVDIVLREKLEAMLDKVDPLELMSAAVLTIPIHNFIMMTPAIADKLGDPASFPFFFDLSAYLFKQLHPEALPKAKELLESVDWFIWIVSFGIAVIIVRNAGNLMGLLEGGVSKIVPMVMGL